MEYYQEIAAQNTKRAWEIIEDLKIFKIWESVGAEPRLVGSLKMGLLMNHRDMDFHIYSSPLDVFQSFAAMVKIAENPSVKKILYSNLIDTDEQCIEWHAWYEDVDGFTWQIDMIHILSGSAFDGYAEELAERVCKALTPEIRNTILKLKYETPATAKVYGIDYYRAVLQYNIRTYDELAEWLKLNSTDGVSMWLPE